MGLYPKHKSYMIAFSFFAYSLLLSFHCSAENASIGYEDPIRVSVDSAKIDLSVYLKNGVCSINDTIDLNNKTLYLPANLRLVMKNGLFKNGCIIGNNTLLEYKSAVFDSVHVKGTWIVPQIKSTMFQTLSYDNSLKDVIALTNPSVKNKVIIESGNYQVSAISNYDQCLTISDNTEIVLTGNIIITPNSFPNYSIIKMNGSNIDLHGSGVIIGDKHSHQDNKGEWGMGLFISGGENISIKGVTIKDCWGDCIYINQKATNVTIDNCKLDHGRRQGISVISADKLTIKNCRITNVGGTAPEYAIDIEPNDGDSVGSIVISNVTAQNCRGGFEAYAIPKNSKIQSVLIRNCKVENSVLPPFDFYKCKSVVVDNCTVTNYESERAIVARNVNSIRITGNRINGHKRNTENRSVNSDKIIYVERSVKKTISSNRIIFN